MSMTKPLAAWTARDDLTLEEVVDAAERLLHEIAPRQTRWAVSERPDVRTIRYYTTRGLLPKPTSYDGGRARYGYSHLVRLLAIKRMQAEHMTLEQIARVLAKTNDEGLAVLVETKEQPALPAPSQQQQQHARPAIDPVAIESDDAAAGGTAAPPDAGAGAKVTLDLGPGGVLVVDADVVADPVKRARLAENLETLARFLRTPAQKK